MKYYYDEDYGEYILCIDDDDATYNPCDHCGGEDCVCCEYYYGY